MAGQITHYWNGTRLVVTSDSGTSSCDLKGAKGDMGIRGPQGEPGVSFVNDFAIDNTLSIAGAAADAKAVGDRLKEIGTGGGGDTSSLPEVTEEDNGKFLRVVDGAWAAAIIQEAETVEF